MLCCAKHFRQDWCVVLMSRHAVTLLLLIAFCKKQCCESNTYLKFVKIVIELMKVGTCTYIQVLSTFRHCNYLFQSTNGSTPTILSVEPEWLMCTDNAMLNVVESAGYSL